MKTLVKPIDPTSRTPSTLRISLRFSQPMRLPAIESRALSW